MGEELVFSMKPAANPKWKRLLSKIEEEFGMKQDMTSVLYLIGVQELGEGFRDFSKQEKIELIHIATCKVLSKWEYYILKGRDNDNWPLWERNKKIPPLSPLEQEGLLIKSIIEYFSEENVFI